MPYKATHFVAISLRYSPLGKIIQLFQEQLPLELHKNGLLTNYEMAHITLCVLSLKKGQELQAGNILKNAAQKASEICKGERIKFDLGQIKSFGAHQEENEILCKVIYTSPIEYDHSSKILILAELFKSKFQEAEITLVENNEYHPHCTLLKSKGGKTLPLSRIENHFISQPFNPFAKGTKFCEKIETNEIALFECGSIGSGPDRRYQCLEKISVLQNIQ